MAHDEFTFEDRKADESQFTTPQTKQRAFDALTPASKGTSPLKIGQKDFTEEEVKEATRRALGGGDAKAADELKAADDVKDAKEDSLEGDKDVSTESNTVSSNLQSSGFTEPSDRGETTDKAETTDRGDPTDFHYLSQHLSAMPGSWVGEPAAQFEGQEADFGDTDGAKYHDIVNSLTSSRSSGIPRDITFESLKGELEGTDTRESEKSAESESPVQGKAARTSVIMSKVPDLPDDTPNAKSHFKHALENMLTNAFGWKDKEKKEGGEVDDVSDLTMNTVDTRELDQVESVNVGEVVKMTEPAELREHTPVSASADTTATSISTASPLINFDSEKSPGTSAFTFVDGSDPKRFTNPLLSQDDQSRPASSDSTAPKQPYLGSANDSHTSVPLASIPESKTFEELAREVEKVDDREIPQPTAAAAAPPPPPPSLSVKSFRTQQLDELTGSKESLVSGNLPTSSVDTFKDVKQSSNTSLPSVTSLSNSRPAFKVTGTSHVVSVSSSIYSAGQNPSRTNQSNLSTQLDTPGFQRITASFSSAPNASSIASKSAIDSLLSAGEDYRSPPNETQPDMFDPDDASALFVAATYPFNATTLESENDAAICLSFGQNDIAFTYNLDESGWGEVILVDSLKRGWVPMNYFKSAVSDSLNEAEGRSHNEKLANSRIPLRVLFRNAGKFLLNPQSKPFYLSGHLRGYVFDVECFNGITDGVRKLLIDTDCISRSNAIVQRRPVVRDLRKKLLRSWSELMAKAREYMHTMDPSKIEYLQLLTFDVLKRAITFLDVWGTETWDIDLEQTDKQQQNKLELSTFTFDLVYLDKPPVASYRINEVYDQLVSYLSLVSGRIDLVEHNIQGCRMLETVVGQINLLVNEDVFIMKYTKAKIEEAIESDEVTEKRMKVLPSQLRALDANASKLEQAVEELNSFVRVIIDVATRRKILNNLPKKGEEAGAAAAAAKSGALVKSGTLTPTSHLYFYSREGGAIVINACKMIGISSSSYRILKSLLTITDEYVLPASRKYPNYVKMGITPVQFVQSCSMGLMGDKGVRKQVTEWKKRPQGDSEHNGHASKRFSVFRAGNSGDMQISDDGLDFLAGISSKENTPFISSDGAFEKLVEVEDEAESGDTQYDVETEVIRSADDANKLLGSSFRALVALLTDEAHPPSYFFTSTFFLTFRIFANGSMLLEELITRFDVKGTLVEQEKKRQVGTSAAAAAGYSSAESQIKTRRRLVCKAFQLWLESYWKPRSDYVLLAPLINFFNEGIKPVLPVEGYQLLVVASKLVGQPPVETMKDKLNYCNNIDSDSQLLPRKISPKMHKKQIARMSQMNDLNGGAWMSELDAYNSFMDDIDSYGLREVKEVKEAEEDEKDLESVRKSLNLGLHLELNSEGTSNSVLLTARQTTLIKSVVMSYRKMLGQHWLRDNDESGVEVYSPLDTQTLIDSWWRTCQESWKCLNQSLILLNFNGLEFAKQLTLIESKMFCSIKVGELLNQNFTAKKLHLNLSPNIQRSILFTNLLSEYVIESILQPGIILKQRIHFFKCWLKVAISCLYLRNFNSLASIMTSLQSFLITRIQPIWDGLSDKYKELFRYLASIIHPEKNYHVYREKLRDFLRSNLEENLEIPIVPYLSLFLQDLTFVVDGNPNYRDNSKSFLNQKLINIDKYFKITQIIADIQTLQVPYTDTGELGTIYNNANEEHLRSQAIRNLQKEITMDEDVNFADMFDIAGVPCLQELVFLEIWKVKQNNAREEDRAWKLSCSIQPRDQATEKAVSFAGSWRVVSGIETTDEVIEEGEATEQIEETERIDVTE
ncbi:DEKNAAC105190 [Brettanomyces naardenensis]|uniref:DEKNAAC105190 n=1 Tax=Brettanomyces naardenensis TaxID=13370 RepID=A0A448YSV5_BRENA|nr:DEKNAAC105190 [Brettanomyces naardenensis]